MLWLWQFSLVWAREHCRTSSPRFLAECRMRRLNQARFVLLYKVSFAFPGSCLVCVVCLFLICLLSRIFPRIPTWMALYSLIVLMCRYETTHSLWQFTVSWCSIEHLIARGRGLYTVVMVIDVGVKLEGSRSGSSLSLQRGLQAPSSSHRTPTGAGADPTSSGASAVHRSTSSANPSTSSSSSAQKPSRRHSQDTHGTMHASAAAASSGMSHCTASALLAIGCIRSLTLRRPL